jgi:uncharacterized membrane protein
MDGILEALTLATGVACGLAAGAFLAFSTFVMDGLRRVPDAGGIVAMQWINRRALTPRAANVPLNVELDRTDPAAGAAVWQRYVHDWTAWNHLRTLLCAVASVLLLLAVA